MRSWPRRLSQRTTAVMGQAAGVTCQVSSPAVRMSGRSVAGCAPRRSLRWAARQQTTAPGPRRPGARGDGGCNRALATSTPPPSLAQRAAAGTTTPTWNRPAPVVAGRRPRVQGEGGFDRRPAPGADVVAGRPPSGSSAVAGEDPEHISPARHAAWEASSGCSSSNTQPGGGREQKPGRDADAQVAADSEGPAPAPARRCAGPPSTA